MAQEEPGLDYNDQKNFDPLLCDIYRQMFDSIEKLGEYQKVAHDM